MPQFLPTRSGFSAVADEMQQVLLERALAAKQAEAEAYKRQVEARKLSQDDRALDLQAEGLQPRPVAPKEPDLVPVWQGGKQVYLPKVPGLVSEGAPEKPKDPDLVPVWRNGQQVYETKIPGLVAGAPPQKPEKPELIMVWRGGKQVLVPKVAGVESEAPPTKAASDGTSDDANRMVDEALSAINTLRTSPAFESGFSGAVGAPALNWRSLINIPSEIFKGRPASGTPEADFARQFEALKAKVTLPNLQMMKGMGALSDAEGKRIEAASITADRATSETEFLRALKDIEDTLKAAQQRQKNRGLGMGVTAGQAGAPRRVKATIDANGNIVVAR